jgi:hypothetical protein
MQRIAAVRMPPIAAAKRPDLLGMLFLPVPRRFDRTETARVIPPGLLSLRRMPFDIQYFWKKTNGIRL